MTRTLDFRLLGPVEAVAGGATLDLGPRSSGGCCFWFASESVPRERMIDELSSSVVDAAILRRGRNAR